MMCFLFVFYFIFRISFLLFFLVWVTLVTGAIFNPQKQFSIIFGKSIFWFDTVLLHYGTRFSCRVPRHEDRGKTSFELN